MHIFVNNDGRPDRSQAARVLALGALGHLPYRDCQCASTHERPPPSAHPMPWRQVGTSPMVERAERHLGSGSGARTTRAGRCRMRALPAGEGDSWHWPNPVPPIRASSNCSMRQESCSRHYCRRSPRPKTSACPHLKKSDGQRDLAHRLLMAFYRRGKSLALLKLIVNYYACMLDLEWQSPGISDAKKRAMPRRRQAIEVENMRRGMIYPACAVDSFRSSTRLSSAR